MQEIQKIIYAQFIPPIVDNAKKIGIRIKAAREKAQLKPEEVALRLDMGIRGYQKYEYGEAAPSIDRLEAIAKIIGVPFQSLMADFVSTFKGEDLTPLHKVPLITQIPASGFVLGFDDTPVEEWIYTTVPNKKAFALRVHGDSMEPDLLDGDTVIVIPDRRFENNKIYAVVAGDSEHTLKTVQKSDDGYILIPKNQKYPVLFVKNADMIKLYRVLEVNRKFS